MKKFEEPKVEQYWLRTQAVADQDPEGDLVGGAGGSDIDEKKMPGIPKTPGILMKKTEAGLQFPVLLVQ